MKRVNHLFDYLISDENLGNAIDEVNATHRWRPRHRPDKTVQRVEADRAGSIEALRTIIVSGFEPSPARKKRRWDKSAGKWRDIYEPKLWPDQYVHHALVQALQRPMMRGMDPYCCGSIRGRGIHYGVKAMKKWHRDDPKGTRWCAQLDIRHFYDSLKPEVVMARLRQLVKDHRVLDLAERVMRDGVMIGAYFSQWFANTTLQPLDHARLPLRERLHLPAQAQPVPHDAAAAQPAAEAHARDTDPRIARVRPVVPPGTAQALQQRTPLPKARAQGNTENDEASRKRVHEKGASKMEYIFGTDRLNGVEVENLKTAGDAHSDLEGYVEVRRVYDDSVICDRFRIVEKYRSMENEEKKFDLYHITDHYRYTEITKKMREEMAQTREASEIAFVVMAEKGDLDDATAGEHMALFPEWAYPTAYKTGQYRTFKGKLYRCLQNHTSQASWEPSYTTSLWVKASDPSEEWPAWSQPLGAHDSYAKGAKVTHNGKKWTSDVDGNVWGPGVSQWTEVTA